MFRLQSEEEFIGHSRIAPEDAVLRNSQEQFSLWLESATFGSWELGRVRQIKRKKEAIASLLLPCKDENWDDLSRSSGRAFAHAQSLSQRCRADDIGAL